MPLGMVFFMFFNKNMFSYWLSVQCNSGGRVLIDLQYKGGGGPGGLLFSPHKQYKFRKLFFF